MFNSLYLSDTVDALIYVFFYAPVRKLLQKNIDKAMEWFRLFPTTTDNRIVPNDTISMEMNEIDLLEHYLMPCWCNGEYYVVPAADEVAPYCDLEV